MSVTYQFRSLEELAAHLDGKAAEIDERLAAHRRHAGAVPNKETVAAAREQYAWRAAADIVRKTIIKEA